MPKQTLLTLTVCAAALLFISLPAYAQITDSVRFQAKNTGFGITDIDKDGFSEILMFDDNSGFVRVYEATAANTYEFVKEWQPNPTNWVAGATVKSQIPQADFDNNGVLDLYLSDTKGNSWIITPGGIVATMFDDVNWTRLIDWKIGNVFSEGGESRGNLIGDVDADGKPDIYIAGSAFASILDLEYDVSGGDPTNLDNYSFYVTAIDANDNVDGGHFARPSNIQLTDMDGDGLMEVVAVVPWSGDNPVDNLLGLYVFEQDAASVGNNLALTNVWHEVSDAVFTRGYILTAGGTLRDPVDIDQDGKGEFLTYEQDAGQHIVYLFEVTNAVDNTWEIVWQYQFSDGTAGIVGVGCGIMVMDIDDDGRQEIVVIIDSYHPDDTANNGFEAGHIFEWDGTDNGIPTTPTATFDPPRDAIDQVRLENNSLVWDVDNDGVKELVLTHRGGNGKLLSIIELTSTDLSTGVTMTVEFDENFTLPGPVGDDPFVLNPIMDIIADEDFGSIMVALLDTVFDDPNLPNDSLRYLVSISSGLITASISGDTLSIFSVADSNGMTEVVVMATDDSSTSVNDTFNVTIVAVGDNPFVLNPIMDIVADEDFGSIMVALLDTVFDDPDLPDDSLRYTVSASSGLITAAVSGDTLWLFSVTDLNGIAEIVITATDNSSISVSDSFNVTIIPVGDDPSRFRLTFPLGDTLNTLQPTFRWNSAVDPDSGDVIEYQISISTSESMEAPIYTESLSDTFHTMTVPLTDDVKYYWSLSANTTTVNPKLDYQTQIEPIFTNNCTSRGCHVSGNTGGGLNLQVGTSFDEITGFATTLNAPLVIAGNPDISPLIWKLEGVDNNGANVFGSRMPFGGPFLNQSTINSIRQWITEGANPSADDSSGGFSFSDTSSFLLDKQESPLEFSLVSPPDNSTADSLRPEFRWMSSVDPDPRDEVKYTLIIRRETGPDSIVYKIDAIPDTTYQLTEDLEIDNYQWWVIAEDADDESLNTESRELFNISVIVGIDDELSGIPEEFDLFQNYPNPFNPSTIIQYALPKLSNISLVIYNLMGQEIMRWDESDAAPGYYAKTWNGKTHAGVPVSSGIYIYRITTVEFIQTRKMVLLK